MENIQLINEIQNKIVSIYSKESLYPLRGQNDSYELNGKSILMWHGEITRHSFNFHNGHFYYDNNLNDLLFISDEIVYFTAHLYFYHPYINTPLNDSYTTGKNMIYPMFENLAGKRYHMYLGIVFEKVYNYWARIGDLIASYFPTQIKGKLYFHSTIQKLHEEYNGNPDFDWLYNFLNQTYLNFNKDRINIVHQVSPSTNHYRTQLDNVTDYEKSKALTQKILSYPDFFKSMNEMTKIGFEKTLNFLEEVNKLKNYGG